MPILTHGLLQAKMALKMGIEVITIVTVIVIVSVNPVVVVVVVLVLGVKRVTERRKGGEVN